MRRLIASSLLVLGLTPVATAEELVREISWSELEASGELLGGEVQPDGSLKIVHSDGEGKSVAIAELTDPGVTALRYAIVGKVRHEDVMMESALEMWSHFPDGGSCFSRTLGKFGPCRSIKGTSEWRRFVLPFFGDEAAGRPERLELNLLFGGPGTVYLGPAQLIQYSEGENPLTPPGAWWDDQTFGLICGIVGCVGGTLGAMIGILSGLRKARRFVLGTALLVTVFGTLAFAVGLAAVGLGQPSMVYFPLLLGGGIAAGVCGGSLPTIRRRYEEAELRRMSAMDVGPAGQKRPAGAS